MHAVPLVRPSMKFNEILPRSPHWLHGESMVADFQHRLTLTMLPIIFFSKKEFKLTIKRMTRSFLRIVILIALKLKILSANKVPKPREKSNLNIKKKFGDVPFANITLGLIHFVNAEIFQSGRNNTTI
jgi:hypothetical protein